MGCGAGIIHVVWEALAKGIIEEKEIIDENVKGLRG